MSQPSFTVFLPENAEAATWLTPSQTLPGKHLNEVSASQWWNAARTLDSEYLLFPDAECLACSQTARRRTTIAVQTMEATECLAALVPGLLASQAYKAYPQSLAMLTHPPEQHATRGLRNSDTLPTPAESDTLADWLTDPGDRGLFTIITDPEADASKLTLKVVPRASLAPGTPALPQQRIRRRCQQVANDVASSAADTERVALRAGLLQLHNFLDESHEESQSIEGRGIDGNGDYWHAIMHRREPDYSNAKYWFRRVGRHPAFTSLAATVTTFVQNSVGEQPQLSQWLAEFCPNERWDAMAFVDFCQRAARSGEDELVAFAERVQWLEMQQLLQHTYDCCVK